MTPEVLQTITQRLSHYYGDPDCTVSGDPLGGLIATILSQSTSDINSERAYADLRGAFASWEAVRDADHVHLATIIRRGGLATLKSTRIQAALRHISAIVPSDAALPLEQRFARWIAAMPIQEARHALRQTPSVGPKTAACVLLFELGLPSMPVDTHVYRISRRMGLIDIKASLQHAHELYDAITPPTLVHPLHLLLIQHGRKTCKAQRPLCTHCPLQDMCPKVSVSV